MGIKNKIPYSSLQLPASSPPILKPTLFLKNESMNPLLLKLLFPKGFDLTKPLPHVVIAFGEGFKILTLNTLKLLILKIFYVNFTHNLFPSFFPLELQFGPVIIAHLTIEDHGINKLEVYIILLQFYI